MEKRKWRHDSLAKFFWRCHVSFLKFSYWSKYHINIMTIFVYNNFFIRIMIIFVYKGLTRNPEIGSTSSEFYQISWDWGQLGIPNLVRMLLIKCYWMQQNAKITAFTDSELLRENQQRGRITSITQIRVKRFSSGPQIIRLLLEYENMPSKKSHLGGGCQGKSSK